MANEMNAFADSARNEIDKFARAQQFSFGDSQERLTPPRIMTDIIKQYINLGVIVIDPIDQRITINANDPGEIAALFPLLPEVCTFIKVGSEWKLNCGDKEFGILQFSSAGDSEPGVIHFGYKANITFHEKIEYCKIDIDIKEGSHAGQE